jgi:hypothetical protein
MTTLHDRLADLAADAPRGGPVPDLWDRGRRYHRQRRVGTAVIAAAAVVVLAVVAGVSWQRSAPVPTPARGPVGLPDRVWAPSPWLPSTATPGRLVAMSSAERGGWAGKHSGYVAISASSGEYAFLDLPDVELGGNGEVRLAPDGRHVAYWMTGPTSDTPNSYSGPISGLAVYDTTTGDVTRHWIDTAHGLMPDFLAWADADTVVFSAGQVRGGDDDSDMDRSSSSFGTVTAWRLGEDPRPVVGVGPGASLEGVGHGRVLVDAGSRGGSLLVDVGAPSRGRRVHLPEYSPRPSQLEFVALDVSGDRFALVPGTRSPNRVHAGPAGALREVPNTRGTWGVLDWLDADTIVTMRRERDPEGVGSGLYRVSLATGSSRELVHFPPLTYGGSWQFATDLLGAPSVDAVAPPSPMDPRLTAGLSVAIVLAALVALVLWRRRVRA